MNEPGRQKKEADTKSAKHPKSRSGSWCRTAFPVPTALLEMF